MNTTIKENTLFRSEATRSDQSREKNISENERKYDQQNKHTFKHQGERGMTFLYLVR